MFLRNPNWLHKAGQCALRARAVSHKSHYASISMQQRRTHTTGSGHAPKRPRSPPTQDDEIEEEMERKTKSRFMHSEPRSGPSTSGIGVGIVNQGGHKHALASLNRSITAPACARQSPSLSLGSRNEEINRPNQSSTYTTTATSTATSTTAALSDNPLIIPSPIRLTRIRDLPPNSDNNVDTVTLGEILGDPMIRECWQFNYMFDVDFLMRQFDPDVRDLVKVKVVHGSWQRESANRMMIDEGCSRYPNVEPIVAYMPEPFGTHHSKMMILLRHDDLAQIVIHTANIIPGDWANMCQAVWQTPLLPLQKASASAKGTTASSAEGWTGIGSGHRFKRDLLSYLAAYGTKKTGSLVHQLGQFDFGAVRGALVASVPSRQKLQRGSASALSSQKKTLWGWPALRDTLAHIPVQREKKSHVVIQVSSVATLGQTDKWLKQVLFNSLAPDTAGQNTHPGTTKLSPKKFPKHSIIFPTPDEIRRSLNGYPSGGSIHMKLQTRHQQEQLGYLRPYLCQWAGDNNNNHNNSTSTSTKTGDAGRRRAAPHIKTYIRFSDAERMDSIDWAMVSSANLSTQAWGGGVSSNKNSGDEEVRVSSWEVGVVVWPGLFADCGRGRARARGSRGQSQGGSGSGGGVLGEDDDGVSDVGNVVYQEEGTEERRDVNVRMVPCFKRDVPSASGSDSGSGTEEGVKEDVLVGLRMPYDLPLTPYGPGDVPWCPNVVHEEPDWLGQTWEV